MTTTTPHDQPIDSDEAHRRWLKSAYNRLLVHMAAAPDFVQGLARHGQELVDYVDAGGAALYFGGRCTLLGRTPRREQVEALVGWLSHGPVATTVEQELLHTDALSEQYPGAAGYADVAAGLLAGSVSRVHRSYVLWFRPASEAARSRPWRPAELDAAADLRQAIVGIVLKRAEEAAELAEALERSNRELEAFSYSVSHDLRAPFRHIAGFAELLQKRAQSLDETSRRYVNTIAESAGHAGALVDSLLSFTQIGRTPFARTAVDMTALVRRVRAELEAEQPGRAIEWEVGELPPAEGDAIMLQTALRNLLGNALKYSRGREPARVNVGSRPGDGGEVVYFVRDNGVGFDVRYADKLFGVFQRLHRAEEFPGTGIGLATVKRIVERHGGRVWAEGELGNGATFYFSLTRGPAT